MTESVSLPPAAAPLHYAVLVPCETAVDNFTVEITAIDTRFPMPQPSVPLNVEIIASGWAVHYANGELSAARDKAEEWSMQNPGQQAVVVQYVDHVQQISAAKWARP